jgi:alpha-mannosidase
MRRKIKIMKLYKDKIFHVISNTHWDREWRFPFQRNRQMLVDMIDEVLEILQSEKEYRAFHLDSQSIVIKDYLEIKPHKADIIKKLVEEKRLFIGPWYVLPEQFQVGGENLLRNLLIGHKLSKQYGRVSKIGYSPFSWGQISQLPQIYREFGINLIMFYRGINSLDAPKAEFLWIGADGTEAVSSRFSTMPRYNFYFYIYRPVIHNELPFDIENKWSKGGVPFHFADKSLVDEDYFIIDPIDGYYPENIKQQVEKIIEEQANDFTTPHVIWMEGHDSSGPNIKTVRLIKDIQTQFPDLKVIHSTLEDYADLLMKSVDLNSLKKVYGERRSSQYDRRSGNMYGYTTSARMYLKQKNFEAEKWIQFYAEPFNVFSSMIGRDINDNYPEIAWELIVQNSAHDSIGGCSLDEIHEDMMCRYKQSIEISKGVFERAVKFICKNIDLQGLSLSSGSSLQAEADSNSSKNFNKIFLVTINQNQFERDEVVECFVDIPKEYDKGDIVVLDKDGNKIESQIKSIEPVQPVLEQMIDRPMYFDMMRYNLYLHLKNLKPFGYNSFRLIPTSKQSKNHSITQSTKLVYKRKNEIYLENDFLIIKLNSNGTFNLFNKETKVEFKQLGYFYDEGESGHAWTNIPTKPFITTLKSKPKIKIEENGSLKSQIRITHLINLPANLKERKSKKPKLASVKIDLILSISKSSKKVELKIDVDNNVESHRLRIMFPTNLNAEYHYGEGQFDVVKREVKRIDAKNWIEQPMYDYPLHHFMDVTDNKNGLAILVDGLKEYEVKDDKQRTIAITLFRAFEYIIYPSSKEDYSHQKGSQCLGKSSYRLALYPHKGDWQVGEVYKEALNFNNHISLVQVGESKGNLPIENSFIKIYPDELIFSALKKSEDGNGFILRIYNPTEKDVEGKIEFSNSISKVEQVTLEEIFVKELEMLNNNSFTVSLARKKIGTYRIKFKSINLVSS